MSIIINCPHCNQMIEIIELNCKIFRCGIMKKNFKQIDPHLCKDDCDKLKIKDKIYGCGKPFRIIVDSDNKYISEICDYI